MSEGHYIARLLFKNLLTSLGKSHSAAILSFYYMEQCLIRDPIKASEYHDFLAEYENFGHMINSLLTKIVKPAITNQHYYISHTVLRDRSAITRLEVVFNASCRTSNGMFLNNHILIGPKL